MRILSLFSCCALGVFLFLGCVSANENNNKTDKLPENSVCVKPPTTDGDPAAATTPAVEIPKSYVERKGDEVIVYIFIDTNKEKLRQRQLEGTAMLRTNAYLRREFKLLPKNYSIPSRRLKKTFDEDTGIYYYFSAFKLKDIEQRLQREEEKKLEAANTEAASESDASQLK